MAEMNADSAIRSEQDAPSGNDNERLTVTSAAVVAIDQYMLGNEQFLKRLSTTDLRQAVNDFDGCVLAVPNGVYRVFRDPVRAIVVFYQNEDSDCEALAEQILSRRGNLTEMGSLAVDTRCFVCVDLELLSKRDVLSHYQQLRREGKEKAARDFLRQQGAAVRYGFQRYGERLAAFMVSDLQAFALLPVRS